MAGFQFIVTDNRGQTKSDDRKTIRSQCMKGKNTKSNKKSESPEVDGSTTAPNEKDKSRTARKKVVRRKMALGPKEESSSTSPPQMGFVIGETEDSPSPPRTQGYPVSVITEAAVPVVKPVPRRVAPQVPGMHPVLIHDPHQDAGPDPIALNSLPTPTESMDMAVASISDQNMPGMSLQMPMTVAPIHSSHMRTPSSSDMSPLMNTLMGHQPLPIRASSSCSLPRSSSREGTPEPDDPPVRTRMAVSPETHVSLTSREQRAFRAQTPVLEKAAITALHRVQPPVGPDITFLTFADQLDEAGHETIHTFFSVAQQMVYPATVFVDFSQSNSEWFRWLFHDSAYLHASLALMIGVRNVLNDREHGRSVFVHVTKSLKALHDRIAHGGESAIVQNSTVAVVLSLIVVADMLKDDEGAKSHFEGLCRIVKLRGGLDGFRSNAKMHVKLGRFDLGASLDSGTQGRFLSGPVSFKSIHPRPIPLSSPFFPQSLTVYPDLQPPVIPVTIHDIRLLTVYDDMSLLAYRVNLVHISRLPKFTDSEFQDYISSIQYRLLQLQDQIPSISDECVRLSLLAVLATTYPLPGSRIRYPYLARSLRNALGAIQPNGGFIDDSLLLSEASAWRELLIWSLLIGALAVFDVAGRAWMHTLWRQLEPPRDWPSMLQLLEKFVWFRPLHDGIGEKAFKGLWEAADQLDMNPLVMHMIDIKVAPGDESGSDGDRRWPVK